MSVGSNAETLRSASAGDTERIAAELAARLRGGDVVLLRGELGAGKTTFVRGAARALGVGGPVTSPTFAIGNLYAASPCEVAHLDLYRLDSIDVTDEAVLDDFLGPRRIAFVEWPHAELAELPGVRAIVTLKHAGGDDRELAVEWRDRGDDSEALT
ncbi:MAG: tRNA (adenosine(37)-N6)-threonylcarbamoyltransferase complex ATPase subunit type 1 TsaE [Actinobacteria bacterium]|nr:tRNA (adenosine(37)-N6)-threonylcarbamoyltransferase complex ATPase subunit type 1 TsaE [Actinomycetota bacterium]